MQTPEVDIRSGKVLDLIDNEIRIVTNSLLESFFDTYEKYVRAFGRRESLIGLRHEIVNYAEKLQTEED